MLRGCRTWGLMTWPCSNAEPAGIPRSFRRARLLRGLGLQPTDKVLDLERRLRCRLCYARDQAVVSIKWKATS